MLVVVLLLGAARYGPSIVWIRDGSGTSIGSALNSDDSTYGLSISDEDSMLAIARGKFAHISHINKFGRNPDIDTGTDPEDIWDVGGLWVPPTAARIHDIASSSANDSGALLSTGTADTGSGLTTLYDAAADFVTNGVAAGDVVLNDTNLDHATVISRDDLNTLTISSTYHGDSFNAGDTYRVVNANSTGASVTHVFGLNSSFVAQEEFIIMNGVGNVATLNTYWRIYRLHIDGAASRTVTNVGNISATAQVDGTVTAQINIGNGQTGMAIYTVPAGKTAYMTQVYADLVQSKSSVARLTLRATPVATIDGAGSRATHFFGLENGSGHYNRSFNPYKKFLANTDIWIRCDEVSANDMDISAGFDLILIDTP